MADDPKTVRSYSGALPIRSGHGASVETLFRRKEYGGRKGRRATKRLEALPTVAVGYVIYRWETDTLAPGVDGEKK